VYRPVGSSFGREFYCSCFLGCCPDIALAVRKASKLGAVPIIMIEVEFLAWEHEFAAADAWCAVGAGQ
jgi:hypothetical protein